MTHPDMRSQEVGDAVLAAALIERARRVYADDPGCSADLLAGALRLVPDDERAVLRVRLIAARWAAAQFCDGETELLGLLDDPTVSVDSRRQAAALLLPRQVAQIRLIDAAGTIRRLLALPTPISADERDLLLAIVDVAEHPSEREPLRRLGQLAHSWSDGVLLPTFLPSYLVSQVSGAYGAVSASAEQLRKAIELAPDLHRTSLTLQLAYILVADDPDQASSIFDDLMDRPAPELRHGALVGQVLASLCRADWTSVDYALAKLLTAPARNPVLASLDAFVTSIASRAREDAALASRVAGLVRTAHDLDDVLSPVNVLLARANAAVALDRPAQAGELVAEGVRVVEQSGAIGLTIKFVGLTDSLIDAGHRPEATTLAAMIDEATRRHPSRLMLFLRAWTYALLSSDPDACLDVVNNGLPTAVWFDSGHIFERAATALFDAQRVPEGARLLREAAQAYGAAGAWGPLARVRGKLRAHGIGLSVPRRNAGVLSGTETVVADLAIRGLTNAAIARRLGTSVGTVGTHLTRIYRKMGVSSRAELPAAIASGGHR